MTDMDQALRDYADRWQRAQEPTPVVSGPAPGAESSRPLRSWPTGPTVTGEGYASALAVADHFAKAALGLADPQTRIVSGDFGANASTPEYVGIHLPANQDDLAVLAAPLGDVWTIVQVGDPPGVTFLPGDGTGPQATVTSPPKATHAEVSETLGSVVKTFGVGPGELGGGVIHLVGVTSGASTNLRELLIVYFDRSGQVVGATGGSYGVP